MYTYICISRPWSELQKALDIYAQQGYEVEFIHFNSVSLIYHVVLKRVNTFIEVPPV